jgi:hypothetical protein
MEALTEQAVEYIVALIVGWISRHVYGKRKERKND